MKVYIIIDKYEHKIINVFKNKKKAEKEKNKLNEYHNRFFYYIFPYEERYNYYEFEVE